MRTTEGVGLVPPTGVTVRLCRSDLLLTDLRTDRRTRFRKYPSRSDQWGRGHRPDAVHSGFIHETAFGKWSGLPVDDADRPRGDRGRDFVWGGLVIQVKGTGHVGTQAFIRTTEFTDHDEWQIVVWCEWFKRTAPDRVRLVGWQRRDDYLRLSVVGPAIRGTHFNNYLDYKYLLPMRDLKSLVHARELIMKEAERGQRV